MKLCACITEKTVEDCIKVIKGIDVGMIEHRIDFMEGTYDMNSLKKIYTAAKVPVIATNRSIPEGGHYQGGEEDRINVLIDAIDAGCNYIDVELETADIFRERLMAKAKDAGCKVIISMHDFEKTPSLNYLIKVMHKERDLGADVGKVVTTANTQEDCDNIMKLYDHAFGFPLVAFTMGDIGKMTRAYALIKGAPFTYVSMNEASAPGQVNVKEMTGLLKQLRDI